MNYIFGYIRFAIIILLILLCSPVEATIIESLQADREEAIKFKEGYHLDWL